MESHTQRRSVNRREGGRGGVWSSEGEEEEGEGEGKEQAQMPTTGPEGGGEEERDILGFLMKMIHFIIIPTNQVQGTLVQRTFPIWRYSSSLL